MGAIDLLPASAVAVMQYDCNTETLAVKHCFCRVQESQEKVKCVLYKAENPMQEKSERGVQSKGQFIEHLLVGLSCG